MGQSAQRDRCKRYIVTDTSHIGHRNPIRYRGYYYDIETGLYYLQSRYYDPEVGRFISADEYISTGQGINGNNMFAYCFNNPVNRVDYTGKWWVTAIVATVVIIGCAFGLTGCAPDVQDAPNLDIENTPPIIYIIAMATQLIKQLYVLRRDTV